MKIEIEDWIVDEYKNLGWNIKLSCEQHLMSILEGWYDKPHPRTNEDPNNKYVKRWNETYKLIKKIKHEQNDINQTI